MILGGQCWREGGRGWGLEEEAKRWKIREEANREKCIKDLGRTGIRQHVELLKISKLMPIVLSLVTCILLSFYILCSNSCIIEIVL